MIYRGKIVFDGLNFKEDIDNKNNEIEDFKNKSKDAKKERKNGK